MVHPLSSNNDPENRLGEAFEAEDLASGETVACTYKEFPDHFGFFLPLAGITTVTFCVRQT